MEQKLFTELRPLYMTSKESPNEIRIRIRMRDLIDSDVLRHAVDTTMERYPDSKDPCKTGIATVFNIIVSGRWQIAKHGW
jgi:hypothetical protein